jgi:hypothetical protein
MKKVSLIFPSALLVGMVLVSCKNDDSSPTKTYNPDTAEKVVVDRFSPAAGVLQVRTSSNNLPAANAPVNFDEGVFITKGLGPQGQHVEYYNFDVHSTTPAPIWVLFREGESNPVEGQLNIIDVLPGEMGYNDFWQVIKVTVPAGYQANEIASRDQIVARMYKEEVTTTLVNCPVVPAGSTATKRLNGESPALTRGWYKEKVVSYFNFSEKALVAVAGKIPTSPIFVTFNVNPNNDPNSGPASGFKTESGSLQTHNVTATIPANNGYSPLWAINIFDNNYFSMVHDLPSALQAMPADSGDTFVNCPIVTIQ